MPVTINCLQQMKQRGEKISSLTAYDASFAHLISTAGIDVILVGDSLGNVIQGQSSTIPVSVRDMCYHTQLVARGNTNSLLMTDMPFMSYATETEALLNARQIMQAGAHMVKLEGGSWLCNTVQMLADRGVPVCAHLGLTPQSVHALSGYKFQAKNTEEAEQLFTDAKALQAAGASLLILECIPASLAADVSASLDIPVIGIGAGNGTDGQILVSYDVLGMSLGGYPKFVKNFMSEAGSVQAAFTAYHQAVKENHFPKEEF